MHRTLVAHPGPVHQARRRHSYWRFQQGRERQISPLEAAFSHANIPWPTSGVTRLWGPGGELHGHEWPDCCGFMVLTESQSQWLILRHGSVNVVLADIGARASEKTWLLKLAERKRRRDSMSRQKIALHTNKWATGVARERLRKLRWGTCPFFFSQLRRPDRRVCSSGVLACSAPFLSSSGDPAHTSRTSAAHLVASSCMRFASCLARPSGLCVALLCRCVSVSGSKPACWFPVLLPPFKASHHAVGCDQCYF